MKEGQNTSGPPLLEGSDYSYRKIRMKALLKTIDERAWKAVLVGWTPPTMTNTEEQGVPKPEERWTKTEDKTAVGNSIAMNAIFSAVDENVFKLIANCEVTKNAWEILITAHEGTFKVRNSRMQMLTTKFTDLKMKEEETIAEFNTKVINLSNEAATLGKPIEEERLAGKVLRSLPQRFTMKVIAIEEMQDITEMKLDELIGSLKTYAMNFPYDFQRRRVKCVALKADVTEEWNSVMDVSEQLAIIAKNLERIVKRLNR
ncbi:unnamed protein product [Rhodiola kirilowii]